jgi:hypothetical protein
MCTERRPEGACRGTPVASPDAGCEVSLGSPRCSDARSGSGAGHRRPHPPGQARVRGRVRRLRPAQVCPARRGCAGCGSAASTASWPEPHHDARRAAPSPAPARRTVLAGSPAHGSPTSFTAGIRFFGSSDFSRVGRWRVVQVGSARVELGTDPEVAEPGEPERHPLDALDQVVDRFGRSVGDVSAVPGDDLVLPAQQCATPRAPGLQSAMSHRRRRL